jgi:hypothetical protein
VLSLSLSLSLRRLIDKVVEDEKAKKKNEKKKQKRKLLQKEEEQEARQEGKIRSEQLVSAGGTPDPLILAMILDNPPPSHYLISPVDGYIAGSQLDRLSKKTSSAKAVTVNRLRKGYPDDDMSPLDHDISSVILDVQQGKLAFDDPEMTLNVIAALNSPMPTRKMFEFFIGKQLFESDAKKKINEDCLDNAVPASRSKLLEDPLIKRDAQAAAMEMTGKIVDGLFLDQYVSSLDAS